MRAVLDTNVLASGFVGFNRSSPPSQLLRAWRAGRFDLVISEEILSELARAFQVPYFRQRLTAEQMIRAQTLLRRRATLIPVTVQVRGIASHPEDDLILATAVSGRVDYLVTGDRQLQDLGSYQGITIVSPRAFLELLEAESQRESEPD